MTEFTSELHDAVAALPSHVQPMLDYAMRIDPAVVMVCDRDARPVGKVFEMLAAEADYTVPVMYRRISKRIGGDAIALTAAHCSEVREYTSQVESPVRLMVIDDYVSSKAGTAALFRSAMRHLEIDADIRWVTLAGRGTALNVLPYMGANVASPWRDRPDIIGVDYDGNEAIITQTPLSLAFDDLLKQSVDHYIAERSVY